MTTSRDRRRFVLYVSGTALAGWLPRTAEAQRAPQSIIRIAALQLMDAPLAAGELRASSQRVARV